MQTKYGRFKSNYSQYHKVNQDKDQLIQTFQNNNEYNKQFMTREWEENHKLGSQTYEEEKKNLVSENQGCFQLTNSFMNTME